MLEEDEVVHLSVPEIHAQIDALARQELGISGANALERLDNGDFDGTILEVELSSLRDLLGEEEQRITIELISDLFQELADARDAVRQIEAELKALGADPYAE
jgi:hypothetical protein